MVQSEISGITFTVHPVTKDKNQMVIEAGFGLGEAIVGGLITPDTYIVHKNNYAIADINVSEQTMAIVKTPKGNVEKKLKPAQGSKQKLIGKQIVEIAKICVSIENHYKHPQDIEWAYEKGKFYITQSRPITTL
jgi:phosphoenolpyruvate synthase/pyruvate phosphate dikinase